MLTTIRADIEHNLLPVVQDANGELSDCLERLRACGGRPQVLPGTGDAGRVTAGGVPLRISVADLIQSKLPKDSLVRRLATLLDKGVPVTLALCDLGNGDDAMISTMSLSRYGYAGSGVCR